MELEGAALDLLTEELVGAKITTCPCFLHRPSFGASAHPIDPYPISAHLKCQAETLV